MKTWITAAALSLSLHTGLVLAHSDHKHGPINHSEAIDISLKVTNQFTEFDAGIGFGILPPSWKNLAKASASVHQEGKDHIIVKLENKESKQPLYILLAKNGDVYDANFTGEFPNLKK